MQGKTHQFKGKRRGYLTFGLLYQDIKRILKSQHDEIKKWTNNKQSNIDGMHQLERISYDPVIVISSDQHVIITLLEFQRLTNTESSFSISTIHDSSAEHTTRCGLWTQHLRAKPSPVQIQAPLLKHIITISKASTSNGSTHPHPPKSPRHKSSSTQPRTMTPAELRLGVCLLRHFWACDAS